MTTETRDSKNSATQIAEPIRIRKILVPIDGSELSLDAAKYAIKIANYENAQIICIHVLTKTLLEIILFNYNTSLFYMKTNLKV
jgi:nucleotide-binding universal stress UspA family protein